MVAKIERSSCISSKIRHLKNGGDIKMKRVLSERKVGLNENHHAHVIEAKLCAKDVQCMYNLMHN